MPVVNINSFESRVNNSDYLTNYTDPYLRQSLANLGQRLSVKGDSIISDKFLISDLFPNYLGDFAQKGLAAEFTWSKEQNNVKGHLVIVKDDGKRVEVGTTSASSGDANASFIIGSADNVIRLGDKDYDSEIYLNDSDSTNGSSYWHKDSAIICRAHDSEIGKDVLIYKIVGHVNQGVYGPYDNEFICEEITVDGEFVDGFRIFMTNEDNMMAEEGKTMAFLSSNELPEGAYEKLVMIRLSKNKNYDKQNPENQHEWKLSVYKCNETSKFIELGHLSDDTDDDIWEMMNNSTEEYGSSKPSELISQITKILTEKNYLMTSNGNPLFDLAYELPLDYDNENNVGWSVASKSNIKDNNRVCTNVGNENWSNDDFSDEDMVDSKLEYFVNDQSQIFPTILQIYDNIMYRGKDASNITLKRQIINQLVLELYKSSKKQEDSDSINLIDEYNILLPIDFVVKYNLNSNDSSVIYNSVSSCPVMFINLGTDKRPGDNIIETLRKITNDIDEDGNKIENQQLIIANGYEKRTVLYDFIISYINESIISSINWNETFILPYIDTTGFWNINGIKTDQYARGNSNNGTSVILIKSDNPNEFNPSTDIIFGPNRIKKWDANNWVKKNYSVEYVNTNSNVGGNQVFTMSSWVPSDKWLKEIANTDDYSYISNALVVSSSSMNMEKDATKREVIYNGIDAKEVYNTKYSIYPNYKLDDAYSYIYQDNIVENSLTYLLGKDTIISSFWSCNEYIDNGVQKYEMTYIKRPGKDTSLDFTYLLSLENYIYHYASNSFNPDDYLHRWVLFDKVNVNLKNNTKDEDNQVYPFIANRNATFFTADLTSNTRSLGNSGSMNKDSEGNYNGTNEQYKNSLNFVVEFDNKIERENSHIKEVTNTVNDRHFDIDIYEYEEDIPVTYLSGKGDNNKLEYIQKPQKVKKKYGTIPESIQYVKYPNEYIPNGRYNANNEEDPKDAYQYPGIDFSEVLARNLTTLNRYNILGVGRKNFGSETKTVLWNAYFGIGWDENTDKSRLKIGTSETNPNLGTSTMIHNESQSHLTPIENFDIDIPNTNISGNVIVKGHLKAENTSWTSSKLNIGNGFAYAYSMIFEPIGINHNKIVNNFNEFNIETNSYENSKVYLLSTISVNGNSSHINRYNTRYYQKDKDQLNYKVSYLNVTKLLEDNHVLTDDETIFNGDESRLIKRRYDNSDNLQAINYLSKIENENAPLLQILINAYKNNTLLEDHNIATYLSDICEYRDPSEINLYIGNSKNYIVERVGKKYLLNGDGNKILVECRNVDNGTLQNLELGNPDIGKTYIPLEGIEYSINSVGLKQYHSAYFLELSTDLLDKENILCSETNLVKTNPIQISYIDIPNSYTQTIETSTIKRIYQYAYVEKNDYDNSKTKTNEEYDNQYSLEYENGKVVESETKDNQYSYNEIWTCDGCEKCSGFSCKLIKLCKLSKCVGSYRISYASFEYDKNTNESIEDFAYKVAYERGHIYKYEHERYGENPDGSAYTYIHVSYYPSYTSKYVGSFVDNVTIKYNENHIPLLVLDANQNIVNYDPGKTILASYVYTGNVIVCDTQENYTTKYIEAIREDQKYSYIVEDPRIYIRTRKSDNTYDNGEAIKTETKLYYKVKNRYDVNGTPYDGYYNKKYTRTSEYSYTGTVKKDKTFNLSRRYVNVRELMTSNSIPQFTDHILSYSSKP